MGDPGVAAREPIAMALCWGEIVCLGRPQISEDSDKAHKNPEIEVITPQ